MLLDKIASYWNLRAEGYSESIHEELAGESGNRFREYLKRAMPEGKPLECLDMGCGPGFFTLILASEGHQVTSADYSPEMLERTKQNCAEAGFPTNTVRADAQALPFADETFDFICSRNLVWNLEVPEKAYAERYRVLKPGGRLFLFDGNYYLYYYNDDYQKARESAIASGGRGDHSTKGVDPTPINEMARELPLSKRLRPDWDMEALPVAGFELVDVERFSNTFVDSETGEEKRLVHSFALWARKPE